MLTELILFIQFKLPLVQKIRSDKFIYLLFTDYTFTSSQRMIKILPKYLPRSKKASIKNKCIQQGRSHISVQFRLFRKLNKLKLFKLQKQNKIKIQFIK